MKKLFGLGLAAILLAGSLSFAPAGVKADEATSATVINPLALYEFQDATNPGKDSSGNGYDLKAKTVGTGVCEITDDTDGSKYLRLDSQRDEDKGGQSGNGGFLYAPALKGKKDLSDMITGSYTVELTFRRDNGGKWKNMGDHYVLCTGKYNNSFGITPWKEGIEYQVDNQVNYIGQGTEEEVYNTYQSKMVCPKIDTNEWTKVVVVGDAENNVVHIYHNGEWVQDVDVPSVAFSYQDQAYTLCIGAQAEYDGNACTMFATVDVKHCTIYDTALSAVNVKNISEGKDAVIEEGQVYVKSIEAIDTTGMDLQITNVNSIDVVTSETLPKKVKVNLSNDSQKVCDVFYYEKGGKIVGYVQCKYANPDCLTASVDYEYTFKINYDSSLVTISDIKLDDADYTLGTAITAGKHEVQFVVTPANDYVDFEEYEYDGGYYEPYEGVCYVDINNGGVVNVEAEAKKFTVTYMEGTTKLGTTKYTYGGSEEMMAGPAKDGFEFEGWYSDMACTQKVEALDYNNPTKLTLYAKYVAASSGSANNGNTDNTGSGSGCNGSVAGMSGLVALFGAAVVVLGKKRRG